MIDGKYKTIQKRMSFSILASLNQISTFCYIKDVLFSHMRPERFLQPMNYVKKNKMKIISVKKSHSECQDRCNLIRSVFINPSGPKLEVSYNHNNVSTYIIIFTHCDSFNADLSLAK